MSLAARAATTMGLTLLVPVAAIAQRAEPAHGSPEGAATARLEVRVTGAGGAPVPGATIVLRAITEVGAGPAGRTGGSGPPATPAAVAAALEPGGQAPSRFGFPPLRPGRYRLDISAPGHAPWMRELELAAGAEPTVEAELRPVFALDDLVARVGSGLPTAGRAVDRARFDVPDPAPATLADWLDGLAGVDVRRHGQGGRQVVSVRGSRPEGVLVLLDGLPVNDPLTGAADLSAIPVSTLASATLVRGAVGGAGSGALAGVLSLRSREAAATGTTLGIEAGSFGQLGTGIQLGAAGDAGSLSVAARYEESRNDYGYRNRVHPERPIERRRNADARSWHGALAGNPSGWPVALRLRWDRKERGVPGRMGTRLFDRARWEESAWQAGLQADVGPWLSAGTGLRVRSMRYRDPRVDADERHGASDLEVRAELRPDVRGRWRGSLRLAVERAHGDRLEEAAPRAILGFAVDRRIGGQRLALHPGLAVDVAGAAMAWSPSLALVARPGLGWEVWARAGRALRAPSFSDLYFASSRGVQPNPDLHPERVTLDVETGGAWREPAGRVELRAALFARRTDEPIVWLPSSVALWSPRNLERLVSRGLELDIRVEPIAGWRMDASGTAGSSRVGSGSSGQPLPYRPTWSGHVALERATARFAGRVEVRAVGERATSVAGTHTIPAFALLDLELRTRFGLGEAPLGLRFRLRNALDERYELVELFPEPGRSVELDVRVGPLPGG